MCSILVGAIFGGVIGFAIIQLPAVRKPVFAFFDKWLGPIVDTDKFSRVSTNILWRKGEHDGNPDRTTIT